MRNNVTDLKILRNIVYCFQFLKLRCLSLTFIFLLQRINPEKLIDVQKKLESFLAQDQDLKERAQRVSHF